MRGVAEFSANYPVTLDPMNSSTHLTNLALFPLCDVHGVLIDTLCDSPDLPGTHADALILGWRLTLPEGMDVGQAAEAVLVVALSIPSKAWSARQLHIVRELKLLTERKSTVVSVNKSRLRADHPMRRSRDRSAASVATDGAELAKSMQKPIDLSAEPPSANVLAKESKSWWKLVGRDPNGSLTDKKTIDNKSDQQNTD